MASVRRVARKPGWMILAIMIAVLAGLVFSFRSWYLGYLEWHKEAEAPVLGEIEPVDGATVYGSDVWIRWASPVAARGRVLWRKVGALHAQVAEAGNGQELLAHLAPLAAGSKYEYIVEEIDSTPVRRSAVRVLNVRSGLTFEPIIDQTVEHDYDQSVKLTLRNRGSQPVSVAAKALKQFDDLPADMTGYGSADVPAQIAPNTTLDLRLAVTAADATADTYEIPIEAGGAYVAARFHVHLPKLNLAFRVTSEDPNTLAKTVEIQNRGDTVTDLAVRAAPANQQDLDLQPAANHVLLDAGSAMSFTVTPILYLEFQLLKAEIEASAAGQTARFPVEFKAPPGKDLIGVRSASTTSSSASDWYCTNKPNTCSNIPGPHGTGPAPSASGEIGSVATVDSNMGIRIAEATKNYDKFPYPPTEKDGDDGIHLDCSGLVARSFMDNGLPDPRDTPGEGHGCEKMWQSLPRVDRPRKGDVVFFDIKHKLDKDGVKIPDHCGIVIGVTADGKVTIRNATVSKGVRENSLEDRWYGKPLGDYVMGYGRPLSLPVPNTCPLRHPKLSGCDFGPDFPKIIR